MSCHIHLFIKNIHHSYIGGADYRLRCYLLIWSSNHLHIHRNTDSFAFRGLQVLEEHGIKKNKNLIVILAQSCYTLFLLSIIHSSNLPQICLCTSFCQLLWAYSTTCQEGVLSFCWSFCLGKMTACLGAKSESDSVGVPGYSTTS